MEKEIWVAIIETLPTLLGAAAAAGFLLYFRKPIAQRIIPRLSGIKILGLEVTLLKESLDQTAAARNVDISEGDKWSALKRAQNILPVLQGARILWVDDQPQKNRPLVKILRSLGADIDLAQETPDAVKLLHRHQYDAVISDIKRKEGADAGLKMVEKMRADGIYRWTVFYVTDLKPGVPPGAFNITNRPDHLLHFVMDILERDRWQPQAG